MLDHIGLNVTDFARSKAFYEQALAPLGIAVLMEPIAGVAGFGEQHDRKPYFPDTDGIERRCRAVEPFRPLGNRRVGGVDCRRTVARSEELGAAARVAGRKPPLAR